MVTCIRVFLYVVLNLLIITSAEILQRDVCLERAISFVREYHEDGLCSVFYESNVKEFFPEGTTATCHVPCQIKIDYWKNYWHYIYSVALEFDGYNYSTKTGCTTSTKAQISIDCTRWRKNQLGIIWSNECTESHADCSRWYGFCICHCKSGYFMNNGRCLPGNIQLNQTCTTTDQCSGSPYASCLGGRCSCIEGYDASNSSDCVLGHQIDTHAIVQTDNSVKSARINLVPLLGALLGGLLLGVVITVIVGYILHRRFCSDIEQR